MWNSLKIGWIKVVLWIRQIETVQAITERTHQSRCAVPIFFYLIFLQARENDWLFTCCSTAAATVFCSSWEQALRKSYFVCKISLTEHFYFAQMYATKSSLRVTPIHYRCTLYLSNFASVLFQKILTLGHRYISKVGLVFKQWKYCISKTQLRF
jgi:hypothetical protein